MAKGIKTETGGWIQWEKSTNMKPLWITLAILAYIGIGYFTYNFTIDYGYSWGNALFTAAVWPIFWIFVLGGDS